MAVAAAIVYRSGHTRHISCPARDETFASSDEADLHKKAKRFAKLLVEEIMLYNQAKVAQGKKTRYTTRIA